MPDTVDITADSGSNSAALPYKLERQVGGATPIQMALRHKWSILLFALVMAGIGAAFVQQLPKRYTADLAFMLDLRQPRLLQGENLLPNQQLDVESLRTKMEMLRSPRLAEQVVKQLNLTRKPEFCAELATSGKWPNRVWSAITGEVDDRADDESCDLTTAEAVNILLGNVSAYSDGRSYIIHILAEAGRPDLAAEIANTYGKEFVSQELRDATDLAAEATGWLSNYVAQIRTQMLAADAAADEYRRTYQLDPVRGETIVAQRLSELNSQLTVASSELVSKEGVLRQLRSLADGGQSELTASIVAAPVLQRLIERYNHFVDTEASIRSRLGPSHPDVRASASQIEQARQQIRSEAARTIAALSGEVAALQERRASIAEEARNLQAQFTTEGQAGARLRELERDAKSMRTLYEGAASRLREIEVEHGFQRPNARVVVEASPPKVPSYPRTKMMVAGIFLASIGVGAGLAFVRSMTSNVYRNPDQIEEHTGLRVLGLFPKPIRNQAPHDVVVEAPQSVRAEALHSILISLTGRPSMRNKQRGRVVLVTSALPGEGKTSFSLALGRCAMQSGISAALIECDFRKPRISSLITAPEKAEPAPAILQQSTFGGLQVQVMKDQHGGLAVLASPNPARDPRRALAEQALPDLIRDMQKRHDLVILDTPPVLAVSDALRLTFLADDVVLMVNWGRSPRKAVQSAIRLLARNGTEVTGVVLSKVDTRKYVRSNGDDGQYMRKYNAYHLERGAT
ncbi:GumC family protein [Paracraurococcus lichenis]|uniref:Polysaccharide biosynthesis tyrosine autokinase n=1 Tax=Paracraurococcus lichenis TaxID=3064888 RepID=A0ABT9EB58_9PROT|nr:polysaccharide biosynthesis tyrosine autokinase [Paracraurococcus sp. LOR1-02]MDO9713367.1 polysaccharide biosynthesis tyrosine autokinase [Paracraurococcus sp. LOR1-02]